MRMELEKLHERLQTTMIYVTHDQVEAMTMANRIFILNDGVIEQIGSPLEVYRNPTNLFVAGFIGSPRMNLISSSILGVQEKQLTIQLPGGKVLPLKRNTEDLGEGERLTLGIRPEHLKENKEGDEFFEGTVDVVEHLGNETYLHITDADKNLITMIADGDSNTQKGETVQMGFHHKNCHIFNATGEVIN
jgi:ABC-type sugar transport system ATPase subunit